MTTTSRLAAAACIALLGSVPALGQDEHAEGILERMEAGDYRGAIRITGDYELDLLARYEPVRFELGLCQSEAHHISFHSLFDDWTRQPVDEADFPKGLITAGFDALLILEGEADTERLLVFSINWRRIMKKVGMPDDGGDIEDGFLLQLGAMFSGNFGSVEGQDFKKIGKRKGMYQRISQGPGAPAIRVMLLPEGGRLFLFVLQSSAGELGANEKRLLDMVKTASFDYKPANEEAIRGILRTRSTTDAESTLDAVKRLKEAREHNAAVTELINLRMLIANKRAKCAVSDTVAKSPTYGISLTNPDPKRWKLEAQSDGVMDLITMTDRFAVTEEGIMVGVVDFYLAYGPQFLKILEEGDEQVRKDMLVGAGRGAAMMTGQLQTERFVPLRDTLAYESMITVGGLPNTMARLQILPKKDYAVMIIVMAGRAGFDGKLKQADAIVEKHLVIE